MSGKTKQYKVDFLVATHQSDRAIPHVADLLSQAGDHTTAIAIDGSQDEKCQIRSLVALPGGKVYKGVFGRCRFGEKPVQGTEDGKEAEVVLKPGHGLVEKNHFLYFVDRNLFVYQRNQTGSHSSKLQRYLSMATNVQIILEPILTRDSYERLLSPGVEAKSIELSFQQPKDPTLYEDLWVREAMSLVSELGGLTAKVRISVGREAKTLEHKALSSAVTLARTGLARVARVKIEDEDEPIDLIADRIIETITVPLNAHGRPDADAIFAELSDAETRREDDLAAFFGA
jgi:hypothetical protein